MKIQSLVGDVSSRHRLKPSRSRSAKVHAGCPGAIAASRRMAARPSTVTDACVGQVEPGNPSQVSDETVRTRGQWRRRTDPVDTGRREHRPRSRWRSLPVARNPAVQGRAGGRTSPTTSGSCRPARSSRMAERRPHRGGRPVSPSSPGASATAATITMSTAARLTPRTAEPGRPPPRSRRPSGSGRPTPPPTDSWSSDRSAAVADSTAVAAARGVVVGSSARTVVPPPGGTGDRQPAAGRGQPVGEAAQAGSGRRIDPTPAVVCHGDRQALAGLGDRQRARSSLRHDGRRLSGIRRRRSTRWPRPLDRNADRGPRPGPARCPFGEGLDRGRQTCLGEQRRVQAPREIAHLADRGFELRGRLVEESVGASCGRLGEPGGEGPGRRDVAVHHRGGRARPVGARHRPPRRGAPAMPGRPRAVRTNLGSRVVRSRAPSRRRSDRFDQAGILRVDGWVMDEEAEQLAVALEPRHDTLFGGARKIDRSARCVDEPVARRRGEGRTPGSDRRGRVRARLANHRAGPTTELDDEAGDASSPRPRPDHAGGQTPLER